jgi:2-polyprenyl-6-methoxyphenol hydroxylase-like FAD-dependent oxidoreductase
VAHVLEGAVPVTRTCRFHRVSSTWRHYEEVALPDGLLVMADAVCSFNPVWGHGMTVAALEADKLGKLLAARQVAAAGSEEQQSWLAGLSQEYQQAITPIIQRVWDLSAGD